MFDLKLTVAQSKLNELSSCPPVSFHELICGNGKSKVNLCHEIANKIIIAEKLYVAAKKDRLRSLKTSGNDAIESIKE